MSPAEELHAAAERIRDHIDRLAEQGTDTPTWFYEHHTDPDAYPWAVSARPLNDAGRPYAIHIGTGITPQVAQHIALWHPGVAIAAAELLAHAAVIISGYTPAMAESAAPWLKLARAINDAAPAGTGQNQ